MFTLTKPRSGLERSPSEGLVIESQLRQTLVVKTDSDSSTAKGLAIGVSITGPLR